MEHQLINKPKAESHANAGIVRQKTESSGAPILTKLTVGAADDAFEQEADRVAHQVMSMDAHAGPGVQRKAEEINVQCKGKLEDEDKLHKKCKNCEEEEKVHRSPDGPVPASPDLSGRLNSSKGGGSPLPDDVRSFMEPRFGADFSQVRVHTGGAAVQMSRELNAHAFAHRQNIYYGAGKTPGKDALTAHELTHVVQQNGSVQAKSRGSVKGVEPVIRRKPETKLLPNWGSSLISNQSKMTLNPVAKLILDGKPAGDNWDIARDKRVAFTAPKCTKSGEIQIVVHGYWFQNNWSGNESGEGEVMVSTAFDVNDKGVVHFKAPIESHSVSGDAAQMTGTGAASDNPPLGGSLIAQVAINSASSRTTTGTFNAGGSADLKPLGVGGGITATGGGSKGATIASGNSLSCGYAVDLTVEKKETEAVSKSQPVYFKVGKHKIIGSRDKEQPANIAQIHAFLKSLPADVRKELEDGQAEKKARIEVVAQASVTTPHDPAAGFNLELSEKRRDAVVRILQDDLGGGAKIKAKAIGELEAIDPGESALERVATITVAWENDPCSVDPAKPAKP